MLQPTGKRNRAEGGLAPKPFWQYVGFYPDIPRQGTTDNYTVPRAFTRDIVWENKLDSAVSREAIYCWLAKTHLKKSKYLEENFNGFSVVSHSTWYCHTGMIIQELTMPPQRLLWSGKGAQEQLSLEQPVTSQRSYEWVSNYYLPRRNRCSTWDLIAMEIRRESLLHWEWSFLLLMCGDIRVSEKIHTHHP